MQELYMKYRENHSYVGTYLMRSPKLLLLEPKLINEVFVSGFKHFMDNDASRMVNIEKDQILCCNPFVLNGNEWRQQRAIFSTLLTNGRIRTSFTLMQSICQDLCQFIERGSHSNKPQDAMDLALRFTGDSLFDGVLGIQANCFSDHPLPIIKYNKEMSTDNPGLAMAGALNGIFPNLPNLLKPKIFPKTFDHFFVDLIGKAFKLRRSCYQRRDDFINHLLEMQKNHQLSEPQLISHAMTFMFDGLDTTSCTIAHCLLLLGRYPHYQYRLYLEIREASVNGLDLPSYDVLNDLSFLSACLYETLRIYPAGGWASKTCTETYTFWGSHHVQPLVIRPGDNIMIPIHGLHHDPAFYPEPHEFQPERFLNDGLKTLQKMGIFFGFGHGPRQCVGMRLGLALAKSALAAIVLRFEVHVHPRTRSGIELDPSIFVGVHRGGVWLDFVKRN
ncbi:probable cytochrome P450 28c1 [Drosophila tropicalis]|uniref:probable cytochrome P450 28c1 n=1 Tax=Drosophila tropicalis TaxID=46794 RepID=UPI0035AC12E6